jgi:hypothetical protein
MPDRARGAWSELVDRYPKSARAGDAKSALAAMHVSVIPNAGARPSAPLPTAPIQSESAAPGAVSIPTPAEAAAKAPAPAAPPRDPAQPPASPGGAALPASPTPPSPVSGPN